MSAFERILKGNDELIEELFKDLDAHTNALVRAVQDNTLVTELLGSPDAHFCVNCEHMFPGKENPGVPYCNHPSSQVANLISGRTYGRLCEEVRGADRSVNPHLCGKDGKYFREASGHQKIERLAARLEWEERNRPWYTRAKKKLVKIWRTRS